MLQGVAGEVLADVGVVGPLLGVQQLETRVRLLDEGGVRAVDGAVGAEHLAPAQAEAPADPVEVRGVGRRHPVRGVHSVRFVFCRGRHLLAEHLLVDAGEGARQPLDVGGLQPDVAALVDLEGEAADAPRLQPALEHAHAVAPGVGALGAERQPARQRLEGRPLVRLERS